MPSSDHNDLFFQTLNTLGEPLFILDGSCTCVFANRAFQELFGLHGSKESSVSIEEFWPNFDSSLLSKGEVTCELQLKNGNCFTTKLSLHQVNPQTKDAFCVVRVLATFSSDQVQGSFHAQRLETLGMLASGIAHDFNNILAGILGHVTYLKTVLPPRGPHAESIVSLEEGARKATAMTQQILNFSRLEVAEQATEVELGDLVERTVKLIRSAIPPEISIDIPRTSKDLVLLGVEGKIAQVIVNLLVNSRDALREQGRIGISLAQIEDRSVVERVFGATELPCQSYACLAISDNGRGMSEEVMAHMFEPYFTTKQGKGSGLGLATVRTIIQELGGAIEVHSQVGLGTSVSVYLPLLDRVGVSTGERAREEQGVLPALANERILVVDDESPVRNVLAISLQHLGYRVETASSGLEALEKYGEDGDPFGLVILDMLMPHLSGERVFVKLREMDPSARVMLISGYTSEASVKRVLDSGGLDFIQKPFTIEELSRRVRNCLERA